MSTYYVATLARYVLVEANNEAQARERGQNALRELYAEDERASGSGPIRIATVRLATDDEIELMRWHTEKISTQGMELFDKSIFGPDSQSQTDWTPMSVPGRENTDGTQSPTTWFAYNRATRKSIRFASLKEAAAFCSHPDNRR